MGKGIRRMAKRELLTTIRDRYRQSVRSFLAPLASSAQVLTMELPARTGCSTCGSKSLLSGFFTETRA